MRRLRFSVAFLMVVSAIIALDMAVMRSLMRDAPGSNQTLYLVPIDGTTSIPFATLALGVLPMASLILLVAIFQMPKVWRTGTVAGFWLGFATFGSFSLFLFVIISSLSPAAIQNYLMMIEGPIVAPIYGSIGNEPAEWLVDGVDLAMGAILLVLPELLLATAGGWLLGRAGKGIVTVRIAREASPPPRVSGGPDAA